MSRLAFLGLAVWIAGSGGALGQEPFPRASGRAGAIVSAKGGEELQFTREQAWRPAIVRQDVIGGDTLRTGEIGTLGVLFADQTTIRVGRQSTLIVNQVATADLTSNTELTMPAGNVWARASRGGTGVTVKTPAASAAIRGTDWSLSVQGDRTSLIVLEGVVEFSNPQGSVTVRQGEGATARIGERPTKVVLVRPQDREQMLFYYELRGLFRGLPTTPLEGPARRVERTRLAAIPPAARSAEDWVAIAENGFGHDRPDIVGEAVVIARRLLGEQPVFLGVADPTEYLALAHRAARSRSGLSARLDLVEAMLAGSAKRYELAAKLFARAERGTSGRQRITAQCGVFAARTLADPKRQIVWPKTGGPDQDVCAAFVTGFGKGLEDADAILKETVRRSPNHLNSSLLQAQVSLLLDRRPEFRAAVERMRATDPDAPETIMAFGSLKALIDSDIDGAVAELRRGVAIAPGDSGLWNALGLAESAREANIEAEAAFREAIATDPEDPVSYANLAILLLDQSRVEEAGVLIDKVMALDPSLHVGWTAKGRYHLQKGEMEKANEFLLAGAAANPASAQGLLAQAIGQYQSGDTEVAVQALDNADRLDRNDPVTSIVRTAIAIDQYRADDAIANAREAVRRYRARGGYFAALATTRSGGSYLGQAYRLLGLEEWGRYYTDRVADPFTATAYFDQAAARRSRAFFVEQTLDQFAGLDSSDVAANLVLQGLLLDPLAAAGRLGRLDLLRRPFVDVEFAGSLIRRDGRTGTLQGVTVSAYSNEVVPTSVSISLSRVAMNDKRPLGRTDDSRSIAAFVGIAPDAANRFILSGSAAFVNPPLRSPAINLFDADSDRLKTYQLGAGYSHTFSYRHTISGLIVANRAEQDRYRIAVAGGVDPFFGVLPSTIDARQRNYAKVDTVTAALGHSIGFGDFTLRSGVEAVRARIRGYESASGTLTIPFFDYTESIGDSRTDARSRAQGRRAYTNLAWQPSDLIQLEGGVQFAQSDTSQTRRRDAVDPRLGIAVSPVADHWLRAAWRKDTDFSNGYTLAPITTVGLVPNQLPLSLGARKETLALRWDGEWHERFFTSVEYQRQKADRFNVGIAETLDSFDYRNGTVNYVAASANLWLTPGIGLTATGGIAEAKARNSAGARVDLPFVPQRFARGAMTFVHPSRIKLILAGNWFDERFDVDGKKLDAVFTADAGITYETWDRRFEFGAALLNVFDKRYEIAGPRTGVDAVQGRGRTLAGSVKVRF